MSRDHEIYTEIVTILGRQLGPTGRKVGITLVDGVVTVTGYVTTTEQKRMVEHLIAAVPGVRAIAEELHVIGEPVRPLSDTTIAHAIVAALDTIPGSQYVTIRVEDGWVTLGGVVTTSELGEQVEQALECVPGVRGTTSEVRVARHAVPA
jgi:osmotically-inducible protein OsmY